MYPLINRLLTLSIITLISINSAFALEVKRSFEHYLIAPQKVSDFTKEVRKNGPYSERLKHRVWAMYESNIKFLSRITYYRTGERCRIEFQEPILRGKVILYRLDPSQRYSKAVQARYERRYAESREHELTHEKIYKEGLERAEALVRQYIDQNQKNCATMRADIKRIYQIERDNIRLANLQYDCDDYGFSQNLQRCQRLKRDNVEAVTTPEEAECKGELVEAFKGKFYCVEGNYRR